MTAEEQPPGDEDPYARWAHRRDPDLDAPGGPPPPTPPPPAPPAGISRYTWFIGVVGVLLIAYITLNTLRTPSVDAGLRAGASLPPFAVPKLVSRLDGDANLARRRGQGAGVSGHITACEVRDPRAVNFCAEARGRPAVLVMASIQDPESLRELDAVEAASRRLPQVRWIGLFLRGDRPKARRRAIRAGWSFPLGWDRHADVAAAYGVKSLPAIIFADARRRAVSSSYRYLPSSELVSRAREAARGR